MSAKKDHGTETHITKEMIDAGGDIIQGFNPELDNAYEMAKAVFSAMLRARRLEPNKKAGQLSPPGLKR